MENDVHLAVKLLEDYSLVDTTTIYTEEKIPLYETAYLAYLNSHKYCEAEKYAQVLVSLSPSNSKYRRWLGNALFHLGELESAKKVLESALDLDKSAANLLSYGLVILAQGETSKAYSLFELAIAKEPNYYPARFELARLAYISGENKTSMSHLQFVIENSNDELYVAEAKKLLEQWFGN